MPALAMGEIVRTFAVVCGPEALPRAAGTRPAFADRLAPSSPSTLSSGPVSVAPSTDPQTAGPYFRSAPGPVGALGADLG